MLRAAGAGGGIAVLPGSRAAWEQPGSPARAVGAHHEQVVRAERWRPARGRARRSWAGVQQRPKLIGPTRRRAAFAIGAALARHRCRSPPPAPGLFSGPRAGRAGRTGAAHQPADEVGGMAGGRHDQPEGGSASPPAPVRAGRDMADASASARRYHGCVPSCRRMHPYASSPCRKAGYSMLTPRGHHRSSARLLGTKRAKRRGFRSAHIEAAFLEPAADPGSASVATALEQRSRGRRRAPVANRAYQWRPGCSGQTARRWSARRDARLRPARRSPGPGTMQAGSRQHRREGIGDDLDAPATSRSSRGRCRDRAHTPSRRQTPGDEPPAAAGVPTRGGSSAAAGAARTCCNSRRWCRHERDARDDIGPAADLPTGAKAVPV